MNPLPIWALYALDNAVRWATDRDGAVLPAPTEAAPGNDRCFTAYQPGLVDSGHCAGLGAPPDCINPGGSVYLVRSIQKSETSRWVAMLGKSRRMFIPLPVTPLRMSAVTGVVVIHGKDACVFKLASAKPGRGRNFVVHCGARG